MVHKMRMRNRKYVRYLVDSSDESNESSESDSSSDDCETRIIQTRNRVRNNDEHNNSFSNMKVNGDVLKDDENIERNEDTQSKETPNLKELTILLEDCFTQKNILNDCAIMHNIPLMFRLKQIISNNKQIKRMKRKSDDANSENISVDIQQSRSDSVNENSHGSSTESAHERKKQRLLQSDCAKNLNNNYLLHENNKIDLQELETLKIENRITQNKLVLMDTVKESIFDQYSLQKKRRVSIDDGSTTKKIKLDKSDQFQLSEMQPENMNSIDDSAWSLILGKTPPQIKSEHFNNTMTLMYTAEKQFINSELENNTNISKQEEEEETDDYISLDAGSDFNDLSDEAINEYCEQTKTECYEMFNNNENDDVAKNTSVSKETPDRSQLFYRRGSLPVLDFRDYFPNFCFAMIKYGQCINNWCDFNHEFPSVFVKWYSEDEQKLYKVIEKFKIYKSFLKDCFYYPTLNNSRLSRDIVYVLKILKKLFEINVIADFDALQCIKILQKPGLTIDSLVNHLLTIVENHDFQFVNFIAKILRGYVKVNYYNTSRNLLMKIENLDVEVVETILDECTNTKTNIEDINTNVVQRLHNDILSRVNGDLLSRFKTLLESNKSVRKTVRVTQIRTIRSPELSPAEDQFKTTSEENEHLKTESTVCETRSTSFNGSQPDKNLRYKLYPIDNLSKPCSALSRSRFPEVYLNIRRLEEGLIHDNYTHIMSILNGVRNEEQSSFTKATYQILCNQIKYSPYKLTKIATTAVQTGGTATFYEILAEVTILTLANLAKEKLWVLAYRLMKDFRIIFKSKMEMYKLNAATVLLFAEIYLENKKAFDAFTLVKRTNIIYSNRHRWKVQSVKDDSSTRVEIIKLLLNTFCETHPHHGLALFDLIAEDQSKTFIPIDLNSLANKLVLSIVLTKDRDMIVDITKLIRCYGLRVNSITFSTLFTALFHIDMNLTKEMYRFAVGLGMYSTPQFRPVTYLIINVNWTKEEIHLAMLNLLEHLSSNIGHAIDHVHPNACGIHLIFEDIPTDKRLFENRISNEENEKIKETKILVRKLLQEEFDPPILFMHRAGRTQRLTGKSVFAYIKRNFS